MTFKFLRPFIIFAILGLVAACTSNSQVTNIQNASERIDAASDVALSVVSSSDGQGSVIAGNVQDQLFGKLVSRGKFAAVRSADAEGPQYEMKVVLSDIMEVPLGARLLLGVLPGGDELTANITVVDRSTEKVIRNFQVES